MVNFPWAISVARDEASSLAVLRLVPGIEVGEASGLIWLRGNAGDDQLNARLAALPACGRYEWIAPNLLRPVGQRIPSLRLPELHWQPLSAWLQIEMPIAAIAADGPDRIALSLVRSTDEREPELLLTNLDAVKNFAATAAQARVERLQFAMNIGGDMLVRGKPLPPLPGRRFVLHGCVAVPAGFSWQPLVSADALARCFRVSGDALLVWNEDGSVTRVNGEQFVPLTRSAIRATELALTEPK